VLGRLEARVRMAALRGFHDGYTHSKLAPFPIGLDLHTLRPKTTTPRRLVSLLQSIRQSRIPIDQLPLRVFCDLSSNLDALERHNAVTVLSNCGNPLLREYLARDPDRIAGGIWASACGSQVMRRQSAAQMPAAVDYEDARPRD
jgi:hypothetical protein